MPSWKRVIVSGSDASLNSLYVRTTTNTGYLTASGLRYPTADNGEESFIQTNGSGTLSLQYVKTIYEEIYNGEAVATIPKGTPVYVSGSVGAAAKVFIADAGNASKMPVVYVSADTITPGQIGRGIVLGLIKGVDTTGYPAGTEVFVGVGGGWTSTRPTGSAIVQVLGYVTKEGSGGQGVVLNPGPASLPNLTSGSVWVGNSSGVPVALPTASIRNVISSSYALSASQAQNAVTASYVLNAISASYALSSSQAQNAVSANTSIRVNGTTGQLISKDDRIIEPNSISTASLQFGFTSWDNNNAGPYADYLHMRSYIDSSGGNDNLIAFRKNAIGMRLWQQTYNSASPYATYRDVALVSGSTDNYLPLWTSSTQLINSVIYQSGSNIGIGTTSPNTLLHVAKTETLNAFTDYIQLSDNTNGLRFSNYFSAAGIRWDFRRGATTVMSIAPDNNIGINTTVPSAKLDIQGVARVFDSVGAPTTGAGMEFQYGGGQGEILAYDRSLSSYTNLRLRASVLKLYGGGGTGGIDIASSGNVGVGTTSPQSKLSISNAGAEGIEIRPAISSNLNQIFSYNRSSSDRVPLDIDAKTLAIQTEGSTKLFVNNSGNIGIGTITPNAKLDVNGNTIVSGSLTVTNTFILDATLTDYATVASSVVGSNNLFTQATGSYTSAFFKYTITSGSNTRAGEVVAAWNGTTVQFYDNSTLDIGTTTAVTASVAISTSNVQFNIQTGTAGWRIKSLATFI